MRHASLEPVAQASHDRRAFALIAVVHDYFRACGAGVGGGLIARTIIDHEHAIDLLQSSLD